MSQATRTDHIVSQGVDELIARLREEGVAAGQQQADELLATAQKKANTLLQEAKQEAEQRVQKARSEATEFKAAAEAALKTAMRDMVLELKTDLTREFSQDLQRLVSEATQQPELLERMILEIVGQTSQSIATAESVEVVLPEKIVGLDELRNDPSALRQGALTDVVFSMTRDMLQAGVSFAVSDELDGGLHIRLTEQGVTLDLSDVAVAKLLLQHLQPRFRAILEGVVR